MTTPITPSEPKCATCGHDEPHTSSAMVRVNTICSATGCWCRSFTPAEPTAEHRHSVAFIVEDNEKADRYIAKLTSKFKVQVVARGDGPVAGTVFVKVERRSDS